MKTAIKLLAAAIAALVFSSCSQQALYYDDATGQAVQGTVASHSYYESAESAKSEPVYQPVVVVKQEKHECTKCGSWFCPKPDCCDTVSSSVLSRATAQGGTGEPHIGLIPTMKTLAPQQ